MNEPTTLWAQIYEHKYLKEKNILHQNYKCPTTTSWVWKNIVREAHNVRENSLWKVGNGNNIKIWEDKWCKEGITQVKNYKDLSPVTWLSKLMDCNDQDRIWDMQKLETYFEDHCIPNIITIEIKSGQEDQLTWTLDRKGCFTTKSLYNKLIRVRRTEDAQAQRMWKEIWSMNVMPRIKTFIWKCVLSILPLNERIGQIIHSINKLCPNCGKQEETLTHLFMYCDFTLAVYDRLGLHMLYLENTDLDFHRWFLNCLYSPSHDISYEGNNAEVIPCGEFGKLGVIGFSIRKL
ncbi:uncharacterized protein LOC113312928 [Papaver somniferum]|uniref:uncharacterized protein LOC113312928 n=1 Tax=Papaver somniferum TaxID=3469 RepID=UPI000E6F8F55|nr:uncharacterized protein LOC113312928 [Papaver somniferum]